MKKKEIIDFYKIITITILFIIVILLICLLNQERISCKNVSVLKTQIIELDKRNVGVDKKVVDFICDDNVHVNNLPNSEWFYASTWKDGNIPYSQGKCMIKFVESTKTECS